MLKMFLFRSEQSKSWLALLKYLSCLVASCYFTPALAEINSVSLLQDLTELASPAMAGRATASAGNEKARYYILQRLQQIGVKPCLQDYLQEFEFKKAGQAIQGHNVLACLPAAAEHQASAPALLLSAHYDHLGLRAGKVHPGADDNASGVAALLALAEELQRQPLQRPVILAFFDAEELGLEGAWAYVRQPDFKPAQLALMVNLDMIGRGDKGELYASGSYHYPQLQPLLSQLAASSTLPRLRLGHDRPEQGQDDWTQQSDHYPFFNKGVPYLYFGVEDHADYHGPGDTADKIPADFYLATVQLLQRLSYQLDTQLATGQLKFGASAATMPESK